MDYSKITMDFWNGFYESRCVTPAVKNGLFDFPCLRGFPISFGERSTSHFLEKKFVMGTLEENTIFSMHFYLLDGETFCYGLL